MNSSLKTSIVIFVITSVIGISLNAYAEPTTVPSWVKNVASWWSEGKISNEEYLNSTQFLVQNGIIKIPLIVDLQNQVSSLQSQVNNYEKEITTLKNQLAIVQSSNSSTSNSSQTTIAINTYPINTKCDFLVIFSKMEWPINPNGNYSWLSSYPYAVEKIKQLQTKHQQDLTNFYKNLWDNYGAGSCVSNNAPSGCEQQLNDLEETQKQEIDNVVYNSTLLNELNTDPTIKGHLDVLFKQALQEPGCLTKIKKEVPNFNETMFK